MTDDRPDIAIFLYGPTSGGAPRRSITLASEFARRGLRVDLVFANPDGPLRHTIPSEVRQVVLHGLFSRIPFLRDTKKVATRLAIPALGRYLRTARPRVLFSGANSVHLSATLAHQLVRSDAHLALRVCTHLSGGTASGLRPPRPLARRLARYYVPRADFIIAGSESVADDLVAVTGVERGRITRIYNPVVSDDLQERANEKLDHPWFQGGDIPVVLSAGRIVAQKDYPTLVRAFAQLRKKRPARLVILGEAKNEKRRQRILDLASELGVREEIDLVGLVDNPFAYMARAGVFALSSAWEGLPGVLIEAMACGCPVVSTDSPGGSREVLDAGRYGSLVPVGDANALALALESTLDSTPNRDEFTQRAEAFSVRAGVEQTLRTLGLPEKSAS